MDMRAQLQKAITDSVFMEPLQSRRQIVFSKHLGTTIDKDVTQQVHSFKFVERIAPNSTEPMRIVKRNQTEAVR